MMYAPRTGWPLCLLAGLACLPAGSALLPALLVAGWLLGCCLLAGSALLKLGLLLSASLLSQACQLPLGLLPAQKRAKKKRAKSLLTGLLLSALLGLASWPLPCSSQMLLPACCSSCLSLLACSASLSAALLQGCSRGLSFCSDKSQLALVSYQFSDTLQAAFREQASWLAGLLLSLID